MNLNTQCGIERPLDDASVLNGRIHSLLQAPPESLIDLGCLQEKRDERS